MIAYIEGKVLEVTENACIVVTAGGVGYEVYMPSHTLTHLPATGQTVCCFTCTVVREDALELFGFSTWDERQTFIILTSINRVGARTALAILSVFRPDDLRRLVIDEDVVSLTRVPGIGKKTAQQLFLELKYKLKVDTTLLPSHVATSTSASVVKDALAGLLNLGYQEDECLSTIKNILAEQPELDVSEVLRASLKALAKGR